jgi:hypothetical protein
MHLYSLFKSYCGVPPRESSYFDSRTDKHYSRISFYTLTSPVFTEFYDIFYLNGVKILPPNIGELLTARGLAYWAMDDGARQSSGFGFYLCTDSFTLAEVELLCSVLKENLTLDCSIHKHGANHHRIYIRAESMGRFLSCSPLFP